MAQETDTGTWDLKPWAGTLDQLMQAAKLCAKRVAEAVPYPDGYDPENVGDGSKASREADVARKISIAVVEDEGFQRTLNAIDDLAEIRPDHFGQVGVININIGSLAFGSCSASIHVSRRSGLEVRLRGLNRTWTAGLKHEIQEELAPRARLRPPGLEDPGVVLATASLLQLPLMAGLMYVLVGHPFGDGSSLGDAVFVCLFMAIVATGFVSLVVSKLPVMELLTPGKPPMYQRWRRRILGAASALTLGIVGSIIAAVILSLQTR